MDSLRTRMEVAADAAWRAGRVTLRYYQADPAVEWKADRSPVTAADREAEAAAVDLLRIVYPRDGIFGEETGERRGESGYRWVVDPLDGTRTFLQGVPLYGVLVALQAPDGEPVVGAIHLPALGELVVAARGEGCLWNGRKARVSAIDRIEDACVLSTGPECFAMTGTEAVWRRVESRARLARSWGDCYGHVLVATGRAEAMLDPVLQDWDAMALRPIVEEAGGAFTDWRGKATAQGKSGVSSNGLVTAELNDLIAGRG
ncbi:MAG: histidinol phosphate phosphatase [Planctomycetes bacterium]|nr:histidinol phosphate phosphatase [Planctomycetota bacterium]